MVQLLLIVGSSIFVLLGVVHGVLTLQDIGNPRNFTPRDAGLRTAMQQSTIALHPKINLWRAWLGFNFSHSLGLFMFGGAFLYVGIFHSLLFSQTPLLQGCSISVPAAYVVISLKFWFSKTSIGSGISMGCFILAAALSYA
ncbi:MAG: hypothetical protein H0X15_03080 [Acidobacteria bacterium]|nr:hypothetical protein [Acidobacteriota bacterium]